MSKLNYHINKKSEVKICKSKTLNKCPYSELKHFDTEKEALEYIESSARVFSKPLKKGRDKNKKVIYTYYDRK